MLDLNEKELERLEQEIAKLDIEKVVKGSHSIDEWKEISKQNRINRQSKK